MEGITHYKEFENKIGLILKNNYEYVYQRMQKDLIGVLKKLATCGKSLDKYNHKDTPTIYIVVDNDFDGYASSKAIYQLLNILGISRAVIKFIFLNCYHTNSDELEIKEQDLLIVSDTGYPNVKYKGNGKVWWIDHHEIGILESMKARSKENLTFINTQLSNQEVIRDLSCGTFIYFFFKEFINFINVEEIKDTWMKKVELETLLSMFSDMMQIHKYPALVQGILESTKTNFYTSGKTKWDYDNKSYFLRYTSRVNNLIRMERFDLIEELIRGNEGEFVLRDSDRMNEDRKLILNTYFENLNPDWVHKSEDVLIKLYQVPLDNNPVMRNHKGLLASMKIPRTRQDVRYIILSRVNNKNKYNYSVRTNIDLNFKNIIKSKLKTAEVGGHSKAFGITILKSEENILKEILSEIKYEEFSIFRNNVVPFNSILKSNNPREELWNIAVSNEFSVQPKAIQFLREDFKDVEISTRRTVYTLNINNTIYEVVSFDLTEKDTLFAVPSCKQGIYDKNKIDILEIR